MVAALEALTRAVTLPVTVATPAGPSSCRQTSPPSWWPPSAPASTTSRPTSDRRTRVGAARGRRRPGHRHRPRRGPGHPRRPAGGGRGPTAGSGSRSRSAAGWPSWVARRRWTPAPRHGVGAGRPAPPYARRVTIHSDHPFADAAPDPVRRFRGRLGGRRDAVDRRRGRTGGADGHLAHGRRGRARTGAGAARPRRRPDARLEDDRPGVVELLAWRHRQLADAFAGTAPAPGRRLPDRLVRGTAAGPRLEDATAGPSVDGRVGRDVGWSRLVTCRVERGRDRRRRRAAGSPARPLRAVRVGAMTEQGGAADPGDGGRRPPDVA